MTVTEKIYYHKVIETTKDVQEITNLYLHRDYFVTFYGQHHNYLKQYSKIAIGDDNPWWQMYSKEQQEKTKNFIVEIRNSNNTRVLEIRNQIQYLIFWIAEGIASELETIINSLPDWKQLHKDNKRKTRGVILLDLVDFTKRDVNDQYITMLLVNEVIKLSFGKDSEILVNLSKLGTGETISPRKTKTEHIDDIHSTGDGYYILLKEQNDIKIGLTPRIPDGAEYAKTILHAACSIRDMLLLLNASIDETNGLGGWNSKFDFRLVCHFGTVLELKEPPTSSFHFKQLFIGDAMNDAARMASIISKMGLNTLYTSEKLYEQLPVLWRTKYFDGSLLKEPDSKGKEHKFYKCVPPATWEILQFENWRKCGRIVAEIENDFRNSTEGDPINFAKLINKLKQQDSNYPIDKQST